MPATAIVREGEKSFCVTVAGGNARRKPVTPGLGDGKRTEILSGLVGDERVVEANSAALKDGQPVEENRPQAKAPKAKP